LAYAVLETVREPQQRVSQLVALDEGSLGIESTAEPDAADAAGERSKLFGSRRPGGHANTPAR
jgi:hypothetical protein